VSQDNVITLAQSGEFCEARLQDRAHCILVIIGAKPDGNKELVGLTHGIRGSPLLWKELLLDLKHRGLDLAPKLVVADGALGFWKAVGKVWSKVREQRCWVHKTANVLNKLPKRRPRPPCRTSRWPRHARMPWRPLIISSNFTKPNTTRLSAASKKIAMCCWQSMIFPPTIGSTCEPRIRPGSAPRRGA
jgi:hypothetical protein